MHVSLSPENEKFIRSQIKNGVYENANEVINASVQSVIEFRQQLDEKIQRGLNDSKHGRVSSGKEVYGRLKAIIDKYR